MSKPDINPKLQPVGSVVYFVKKRGWQWSVSFGTVLEHYVHEVCIQLYEFPNTKLINGIPVKELARVGDWHKLPKNWEHPTDLYEVTHSQLPDDWRLYDIKNPEEIAKAIEIGMLVCVRDNDHANVEADIDSRLGWRLVKKYEPYKSTPSDYTTIHYKEVYTTYKEAQDVVDQHEAELKRQSELTDYEWSVEQIDHTLDVWSAIRSIPEDVKKKYRDWILNLDKVEDVVTRIYGGEIQWKYDRNQRWMNIEV